MKIIVNTKILVYCAVTGTVLCVVGVLLGFKVFPMLVNKKVWENSVLQENTRQWDLFKKIPFPFQIKISFFDVQNADEILQGAKPVVKEVGPYIYKLFRWKDGIEWNDDEISYYDYMKFEFDKEASGKLSDEDVLTILNSPFNALLMTVEELSTSLLATVNDALPIIFNKNNGLFITAKVKDLLFEGMIICENGGESDFAAKMICGQFKAKAKVAKGMSIVNKSINYSYLSFKNNTHLGRLTIKSGLKEKEDISTLVKYNNQSYVSVWRDDNSVCNDIKSTTTFRPYVTPNMTFDVFSEDICRRLKMAYQSTETVKGIQGYKYVVTNDSFNAPRENTDNYCYCVNRSRTLEGDFGCLQDGLLDMTNCVGAPVLLSFPHLLYGDKKYLASVDGLHPDPKLHETFVILEPTSGAPLQVAKRVQFNMFIRAIEDITSIENVTNALVPIFWLEESMTLDDQYINIIKQTLLNNLKILEIIKWSLIGVGGAVSLVSLLLFVNKN
ncbi:sensory neuron membrane protein 2-like [Tribolium madens]|uniref:sensory neuron membrane protein 2-like n=1 Tax=Tribolium madens TaxID=41895 RepID=UPI001CF742DA|nr:sensory neuron membrane protein 2-like [Tribolium madens]